MGNTHATPSKRTRKWEGEGGGKKEAGEVGEWIDGYRKVPPGNSIPAAPLVSVLALYL